MNRKTVLKAAFFFLLFGLVVFLLRILEPDFLRAQSTVFLLAYDILIAVLGLYIILFFRHYTYLDLGLFLALFLTTAVGFFLLGRTHAIPSLTGLRFFLLSAAAGLFYGGITFIPGLYEWYRNAQNEDVTRNYSPLIEQFLQNERAWLEMEEETARLEKNKESMSTLSDVAKEVNRKRSVGEVCSYLKDVFVERLGVSNMAIVIRSDEPGPDRPERHLLAHGLSEAMNRYLSFVEDKVSHFFYLSNLSFYTLRIADDWPEADRMENEPWTSFMVIPFYVGKKPRGFVGFFLKKPDEIKDMQLNFAIFTVRNISLALNKILLYEKILRLSLRDGLTRLFLRRVFNERLDQEVERTRRYASPLSLVIMDVDHFKLFNDNYGHLLGDDVLRKVGANILQALEEPMMAARYGGEEFAVICPAAENVERFASSAKRLIQDDSVRTEKGEQLKITISIGIAHMTPDIHSAAELIRRADEALYYAKEHGRNRIVLYPDKIL